MRVHVRSISSVVITLLALTVIVAGCGNDGTETDTDAASPGAITIGSKNFTEQLIVAELMSQMLESRTELNVQRRMNLGGTMICHGALVNGNIDMYAEYTGTALTAILQLDVISDPEQAYKEVKAAYDVEYQAEWLEPFGFNNTYAITARKADSESNNWNTISDLAEDASELKAGFTAEFFERSDGYLGLKEAYGFEFGSTHDMEPGLMYKAIEGGKVDIICAFATDGRIPAYGLQPLEDDKNFFPPYYAAPVVRNETLAKYPEIRDALAPLAGVLDDVTMQQLNYLVDEEKQDPTDVARDFLMTKDLLKAEGN